MRTCERPNANCCNCVVCCEDKRAVYMVSGKFAKWMNSDTWTYVQKEWIGAKVRGTVIERDPVRRFVIRNTAQGEILCK